MSASWILNQYSRRLCGKIPNSGPAHHGTRTRDLWYKRPTLYLCTTVFHNVLVMQQLASRDQNPYNATQNDMWKHGARLLPLPQRVQFYCIAGLIHPGITDVRTDGVVWLAWCWKRPKTPNNTNKTTFDIMISNASSLSFHNVFSPNA